MIFDSGAEFINRVYYYTKEKQEFKKGDDRSFVTEN